MEEKDLYMCRRALQSYLFDMEKELEKSPEKYEGYNFNYKQAKITLKKIENMIKEVQ